MVKTLAVIGCQAGDEGKGKIVDFLAENADCTIRFNGGPNAGHTIKPEDKELVLHQIPSGIARKKLSVISHGCATSLEGLAKEMQDVRKFGIEPLDYLRISKGTHLILPNEKEGASTSTGRGIAPTYKHKHSREGLRAWDLIHAQNFENDPSRPLFREYLDYLKGHADLIALLVETPELIHELMKQGKRLLFEGAQGFELDIDYGQYPFVTSSSTGIAGIFSGAGISHKQLNRVIGVAKAYVTRAVDKEAPIPTEMDETLSAHIREKGHEYGATTGLPRRIGWLNVPELRLAIMANGLDALALTKLDLFDDIDTIRICTSYDLDGKKVYLQPSDGYIQKRCIPKYIELDGWKQSLNTHVMRTGYLPGNARNCVRRLETLLGIPITLIGTGQSREDIIVRQDPWKD